MAARAGPEGDGPRAGHHPQRRHAVNWLLLLNALYFLFGATMYVGTMWVLKFFLYPTWESLDRGNVDMHFGIPTRQATKFFTVVVPPMFISGIILAWTEWGTV